MVETMRQTLRNPLQLPHPSQVMSLLQVADSLGEARLPAGARRLVEQNMQHVQDSFRLKQWQDRLLEALPGMRNVFQDRDVLAPLMTIADMLEAQGAEKNKSAILMQLSEMLPSVAARVAPRLGEV